MSDLFFFFNDTATTEIYTLSLHDALPISDVHRVDAKQRLDHDNGDGRARPSEGRVRKIQSFTRLSFAIPALVLALNACRSEEHTSELQSRQYLVCRLLLEKKITPKRHLLY